MELLAAPSPEDAEDEPADPSEPVVAAGAAVEPAAVLSDNVVMDVSSGGSAGGGNTDPRCGDAEHAAVVERGPLTAEASPPVVATDCAGSGSVAFSTDPRCATVEPVPISAVTSVHTAADVDSIDGSETKPRSSMTEEPTAMLAAEVAVTPAQSEPAVSVATAAVPPMQSEPVVASSVLTPSEPTLSGAVPGVPVVMLASDVATVPSSAPDVADPRRRSRSRSLGRDPRQPYVQDRPVAQAEAAAAPSTAPPATVRPEVSESLFLPRWLRSRSRSGSDSDGDRRPHRCGPSPPRDSRETFAVNSGGLSASCTSTSSTSTTTATAGAAAHAPVSRRPDPVRVIAKLRKVAAGDENGLALLTGIVCGLPASFTRAEMQRELQPHIADSARLQGLLTWLEQGHLESGDVVRLQGLKAAPHLNGLLGRCEEWDRSNSRWKVRLDNAEVKAVKPDNIVAVRDNAETGQESTAKVFQPASNATYNGRSSGDSTASATASGTAEQARSHVSEAALNKLKKKAEAEARGEGPQRRRFGKGGDEKRDRWELPPRDPIAFVAAKEKDAGPSRSVTVHDPRGSASKSADDDEDSDEGLGPGRIVAPAPVPQAPLPPRPQRRVPRHQPAHVPVASPSPSPFDVHASSRYAPYQHYSAYAAPPVAAVYASPPAAPPHSAPPVASAQPVAYVEGEGAASLPVVSRERGGRYAQPAVCPADESWRGQRVAPQGDSFDGVTPGPPPAGPPPAIANPAAFAPAAPNAGAYLEQQVPAAAVGEPTQSQGSLAAANTPQDAPVQGNLYYAVSDAARKEDKAISAKEERRKALEDSKIKMNAKLTAQLQQCMAKVQSGELDEPTREKYEDFIFKLKAQMVKITGME